MTRVLALSTLLLGGCAPKPAVPMTPAPPPPPPAMHVRCFEGVDGRAWSNTCTLSSQGVTIALGAVGVLPPCAARGGPLPRLEGGWPSGVEGWTPACYGAGDGFMCAFVVEATGRPGQPPADVVVWWDGGEADLDPDVMPTFDRPLAPFPTTPDGDLDAHGGVEVEVWPRTLGRPVILDASCAAGTPLP